MKRIGPPTLASGRLEAPLGGLNTVDGAGSMPASDCVRAFNVIPSDLGLRNRKGFQEWCTGLTGSPRATLSFRGSTDSEHRLFQTTSTGIWDVTSSSASPSQVFTFASSANRAGWGVAVGFVNAAGHHLFYADEENGLFIYTESTGLWTQASVTGVAPEDVRHVAVFKSRVWLTEKDSASAWYLDVSAITGAATEFSFGNQFRRGGTLVGLWNWTYDGGSGLDDSLVGLSSGGDVAVYQGTDPTSADTFALRGVWAVAPPPQGRLVATDAGGDLLLLTRTGVRSLSALVSGGSNPADKASFATAKISPLFARYALERGNLDGWSIFAHPTDNCLVVTVPQYGDTSEQLAMYLGNGSWWPWRNLPIVGAATYGGELYFGTPDGRVCVHRGHVDGVLLSDSESWSAIECLVLPAFQSLGSPRQKQLQLATADFLGGVTVAPKLTARYDYDLSEPTQPTDNGGGGSSAWDEAVWDDALWSEDNTTTRTTSGLTGVGKALSVCVQWNAIAETTLIGVDVSWTSGGLL